MIPVNALFFDLDGTLLDTAPDLATAINIVLGARGQAPLSLEEIRPTIAKGTRSMVWGAFGIDPQHPDYEAIKNDLFTAYQDNLTKQTSYFDGMETVLNYLDDKHLPWGIVTNKPGWLATPLIEYFELNKRSRCLISGDTLAKKKPDPDPLFHACTLTGVSPTSSLYIGDSESDVQAAKAAGMLAMVAAYGYLEHDSQPHTWQADAMIDAPLEIIEWLQQHH